ncbi:serine esterase (DUF676) protein [Besnoitia besnoiti]|uniref:Serine esterase (DUF676) protein n=1 Tax=Besnoitia besnoiti TaxID=94643 RepID=A0A2A9M283_BESBE|nr:serine esterase (DUF676) protein [Besnoitia besnoiti]PFH32608.1 serine esterase (DUF676) protein [Besnoitia besnoiti]
MSLNLLVEFALHFTSFRNIDLLQQGIYHVKAQLSLDPRSSLLLPVEGRPSPPACGDDVPPQGGEGGASSVLSEEAGGGTTSSWRKGAAAGEAARNGQLDGGGGGGVGGGTSGASFGGASGAQVHSVASGSGSGVYLRRLLSRRSGWALAAVPYSFFSSPLQQDEGAPAAGGVAVRETAAGGNARGGLPGGQTDGEKKRSVEQQQHWAYDNGGDSRTSRNRVATDANEAVLLHLQEDQQEHVGTARNTLSSLTRGIQQHKRRGGGAENRNSHALVPPKIDERDNSFCTRGFLIRYCDEQVALSETVCFRVEVPFSSPEALTNLFAVLQLGLYFAPYLPQSASLGSSARVERSAANDANSRGSKGEQHGDSGGRATGACGQEKGDSSGGVPASSEASSAAARKPSSGTRTREERSGRESTTKASASRSPSAGVGSRQGRSGERGDADDDTEGAREGRDETGATCLAVKLMLISNFLTGIQTFVPVIFDESQFALMHMLVVASVVDIRLRLRPALPLSPFPLPVPRYLREHRRAALRQQHRLLQQYLSQRGPSDGRTDEAAPASRRGSLKAGLRQPHARGGAEAGRRFPRRRGAGGKLRAKHRGGLDSASLAARGQGRGWGGEDDDFTDEAWSDSADEEDDSKGGQSNGYSGRGGNAGASAGQGARPGRGATELPEEPQEHLLLTLEPSLPAFLVGAGTAFAQAGGAAFSKDSARQSARQWALVEDASEATAAAAAAAGAARGWLCENRSEGRGSQRLINRAAQSEECPFDEENLLGCAAALHAASLQLLIEVYVNLATAAAKLFTRCLLPERRHHVFPLQQIDNLVLPGGGVLEATGASFHDPTDGLGDHKERPPEARGGPQPASPTRDAGLQNSFMRLLINRGRSSRRGPSPAPAGETRGLTSGGFCGSAHSRTTRGDEGFGSPLGLLQEGEIMKGSGADGAAGVESGRANCGDGRLQNHGDEKSVEVKVLRLEQRLTCITPDALCSVIASDVHVIARQLFTLWSRLLAAIPIISREMELLLRVNWEHQYVSRLSAFVLQHVVPLRATDRLYFPPPAVADLPEATTAGMSPSALIPPAAAASAAAATAAAALARRGCLEDEGEFGDEPGKRHQQGAVAAALCASEEAMSDFADDWRIVVGKINQRPMDVHDCRLLVGCDRHPVVFEQRYRKCAFSISPPPIPPCLPLRPPSSSLSLACAPPSSKGIHLFVLVHGFQGSSHDMRLLRNNIAAFYPAAAFLCSSANQEHTEGDIEVMGKRLADEVHAHIQDSFPLEGLAKLSFIGHSLGGVIIRAALPHLVRPYGSHFFLYLSLSSPHFGFVKSKSRLVSIGVWLLKKWRKSLCLQQLTLSDAKDYASTFLYRLSRRPGLNEFRHICLVASSQDTYAPLQSAAILLQQPRAHSHASSMPAVGHGTSGFQGSTVPPHPDGLPRAPGENRAASSRGAALLRADCVPYEGDRGDQEFESGDNPRRRHPSATINTSASGQAFDQETRRSFGGTLATECRDPVRADEDTEQPTRQSHVVELMGRNLLGNVSPEKILRLNVNFKISEKNFDSFIGRAAHILFLENQAFMRTLLLSHPYLFK